MEDPQLTFLKEYIEERVESINGKRLFYRRKSFYAFIGTAVMSALSAVLLGLNIDAWKEAIRIIVLIIAAVITVITSYNAFFNYKELWIGNNDALNRFYRLRFKIEFYEKGKQQDAEAIINFKNEYQSILDDLNQVWQKARIDSH